MLKNSIYETVTPKRVSTNCIQTVLRKGIGMLGVFTHKFCEIKHFISKKAFCRSTPIKTIHLEKVISLNCSHGKNVFISVFIEMLSTQSQSFLWLALYCCSNLMKFLRNTLESGSNSKQAKNSLGQHPEGSCLPFFLGLIKGFMAVFSIKVFGELWKQVNNKFQSSMETWGVTSMFNIPLKFQ